MNNGIQKMCASIFQSKSRETQSAAKQITTAQRNCINNVPVIDERQAHQTSQASAFSQATYN